MTVQLALLFFFLSSCFSSPTFFPLSLGSAAALPLTGSGETQTERGVHVPIYRQRGGRSSGLRRRAGLTGDVGLGDFVDITYSFLVSVGGGQPVPLVLDTGSSDLWVASDACTACRTSLPLFPQATVAQTGLGVNLQYGDSRTGTHASGIIGTDSVTFAGITIPNQYFAAINDTDTNVLNTGCAGIFGMGFSLNSLIWNEVFTTQFKATHSATSGRALLESEALEEDDLAANNYGTRFFPDLNALASTKRAAGSVTQAVFQSYLRQGTPLTRMVTQSSLAMPMFSITLQRDTLDIGGNAGILSIGELPTGIQASQLTWVPVRGYPNALEAPADSPNEIYPIAWEVFVNGVYLDGQLLPKSNLTPASIEPSALLDTGNSLIRGPTDVVNLINSQLGSTVSCGQAHILEFDIGGTRFPVDPRDLVSQATQEALPNCAVNIVPTDSPVEGRGYQYSWSLGDPFLKSVLSSFYFGNITHPSVDEPRVGLMSTVPPDAAALLQGAISDAIIQHGSNEFTTSNGAPAAAPTGTMGASGIPASPVGNIDGGKTSSARTLYRPDLIISLLTLVVCTIL